MCLPRSTSSRWPIRPRSSTLRPRHSTSARLPSPKEGADRNTRTCAVGSIGWLRFTRRSVAIPRWSRSISGRSPSWKRREVQTIARCRAPLTISLSFLIGGTVVVEWAALIFAVGAVLVLRRKMSEAPRPFRTPGYPLVPLFFVVGTVSVCRPSSGDRSRSAISRRYMDWSLRWPDFRFITFGND